MAELGTVERAYADGYAAAQHKIEQLRAALEPFARFCEIYPKDWKDAESVTHSDADGDRDLTLGDFRRAAAALKEGRVPA